MTWSLQVAVIALIGVLVWGLLQLLNLNDQGEFLIAFTAGGIANVLSRMVEARGEGATE
jgi:hypothetical protein